MNPYNTVFDAKRLIGRKWADEDVQADMKREQLVAPSWRVVPATYLCPYDRLAIQSRLQGRQTGNCGTIPR